MKKIVFIYILLYTVQIQAQKKYINQVFDKNIKSVQLNRPNWKLDYPVFQLNSNEKLQLQFDDLSGDTRDFYYEILYCNADWTISDLLKSDYLKGFDEQVLQDFEFSSNTTQSYIHYRFEIPNQDVHFLLSGNYIVKIYLNDDKKNLILTRRFYLLKEQLKTNIEVIRPILSQYNLTHQQINLKIVDIDKLVRNPYDDLKVIIKQNNRSDRQITLNTPTYVEGNTYIYNNEQKNILPGGNEFYHFDTKNIRFKEIHTDSIRYINNHYHFYIQPDELLPYRSYESQADINGRFFIQLENSNQSNIYADYMNVHLSVQNNKYLMGGELYVVGDFNNWQINKAYKLNFNAQNSLFECNLNLKQGYYNYSYRFVRNNQNIDIIDNHSETENDYLIYIYLKDQTLGFDKLVSFSIYNTNTGLVKE